MAMLRIFWRKCSIPSAQEAPFANLSGGCFSFPVSSVSLLRIQTDPTIARQTRRHRHKDRCRPPQRLWNPPTPPSERERDKKLVILHRATGHDTIPVRCLRSSGTSPDTVSGRRSCLFSILLKFPAHRKCFIWIHSTFQSLFHSKSHTAPCSRAQLDHIVSVSLRRFPFLCERSALQKVSHLWKKQPFSPYALSLKTLKFALNVFRSIKSIFVWFSTSIVSPFKFWGFSSWNTIQDPPSHLAGWEKKHWPPSLNLKNVVTPIGNSIQDF
jgi:hypothetical protein